MVHNYYCHNRDHFVYRPKNLHYRGANKPNKYVVLKRKWRTEIFSNTDVDFNSNVLHNNLVTKLLWLIWTTIRTIWIDKYVYLFISFLFFCAVIKLRKEPNVCKKSICYNSSTKSTNKETTCKFPPSFWRLEPFFYPSILKWR